jgi:hypothetical protein
MMWQITLQVPILFCATAENIYLRHHILYSDLSAVFKYKKAVCTHLHEYT